MIALHLTPADDWESTATGQAFVAPSLAGEGFIHLTHREADLVDVANLLYRGDRRRYLVLVVELDRLTSPWRYDGDERYPHVYGPLDRAAIVEVRSVLRAPDGRFAGLGDAVG